ncbi:HAMP domain-containing sensor histidine kinase [Sphingomonas sp. KR1UV-12]|uniref:histidine kinase n=1 Tax=Sphingomonas aurea TaxID=3063994 RepID=A0ABT9EKH9_9SPHN|nr:HAMP domain-containing sensor histidine kinase [Sphingomonas sp. KR1UV-12]MDP1027441.1 HAMP domain-containing sensor histidine kinase [Sphingomonas sp. KR1UV-12]
MRLSVTARIALLAIALALVSNLVLVGFVWKQTHDDAIAATRREMIEQSDALLAIWHEGGAAALSAAVRDARPPGDVSLVVAVLDHDGRRLVGYAPDRVTVPLRPTHFRVARLGEEGAWGLHDTGYLLHAIGGYWLLTGRNLDVIEAEQRAIESALALAVTLSLALGIGAGLVLARYVGARLDRIAGVVEAAGQGDLSRRVEMVAGGADAFDRLAARLNVMLGRIERLMTELRVVTDSLAHDLRSPLARLRTKTEQAVMIADPAARDAMLGGLLAETDVVMRMLTMVIEISRAESVSRDRFTDVDPAALIEEIADLYGPVAEEAGLAFVVAIDAGSPVMRLHRELISQAITNLIDNALKHAAAGGMVTLRLAPHVEGVAIQVEDRGTGIAASDRAQALRRFGRLDTARTTPGAGLGMSLIDTVARLHDGRFELADNHPGLIARIILPL